ncbi:heavy-metal-associated domain-containing protein [Agromyces sp. MMS24-JH15]|uniref:heavy-metal-associated domain-containing protein n=1 Tax=Agromyces sp. MMS24-JH15 TaxID=3243765 RepID=UPI003748CEA4
MRDLGLTPVGSNPTPAHGAHGAGAAELAAVDGTVVADYGVTGMTCSHCVSAVAAEFRGLDGVRAVGIELVAGGVSRVRVGSDAPLEASAVAAAIDEAGYEPAALPR